MSLVYTHFQQLLPHYDMSHKRAVVKPVQVSLGTRTDNLWQKLENPYLTNNNNRISAWHC